MVKELFGQLRCTIVQTSKALRQIFESLIQRNFAGNFERATPADSGGVAPVQAIQADRTGDRNEVSSLLGVFFHFS